MTINVQSLPASANSVFLPTVSLWQREVVRFVRQRSRVVGALGTPVVFWLLIGSGLRHALRLPGAENGGDYLQYAFPGTVVLIVLFTAVFSMISIVEDRHEGFLQGVLVAPIGRSAIVLGKLLGGTTLALVQAGLFLLLAPLIGVKLTFGVVFAALGVLTLISLGLCALGFLLAWSLDSTQGFHAIINLALMPMWLLSGAFFPASGAAGWMAWLMNLNPLTYGVACLRHVLHEGEFLTNAGLPSFGLSLATTIVSSTVLIILAVRTVRA